MFVPATLSHGQTEKWWGSQVDQSLVKSGPNRSEWEQALAKVPAESRAGLEFLLSHMPEPDLKELTSDRILETIELAYQSRAKVPWGKSIPEDVFLNDVLPYCNIDEPRDPWRREFQDRFLPLVVDCKTPGEAALILNSEVFKKVKVKYSTKRKRANQSPKESMDQGLASCTGLSILLVDACRACGVPARLAGIAKWPNKPGNHTWVEIWDDGWHFVGAAEPAREGLNHAWFTADAAQAVADSELSSIRAVSYRQTPLRWPLVWSRSSRTWAVNVTDRYAGSTPPVDNHECRLLVKVLDHQDQRNASVVSVHDANDPRQAWAGNSADESQDTNDILAFQVPRNRSYVVSSRRGPARNTQVVEVGDQTQTEVLCKLPPPSGATQLLDEVVSQAERWFRSSTEEREKHTFDANLEGLLRQHPEEVREAVWQAYVKADLHADLRADFEKNQVQSGEHLSPYVAKEIGKKPPNGWPLFIAMHGGGGTTQAVNDSQWRHMQIYYRDQPQLPGYRYLALRAPNNSWNGFYTDYVYPLIHRLVVQQVLFADVDPDRVFIMGYSHGGYGAFAIGPKMPDHFAAIHSSAAAPTDGQSVPETLRNTRFTFMIGEKDTRYGRAERCQQFANLIKTLRGDRTDIYPVSMEWKAGFGHGGLPDRNKISDMYRYVRRTRPTTLAWRMSDPVIRDFFWLSCDQPQNGKRVDARVDDNVAHIRLTEVGELTVWLDERLVNFEQPVRIEVSAGETTEVTVLTLRPSLENLCQSMLRRSDRAQSFSAAVRISNSNDNIVISEK